MLIYLGSTGANEDSSRSHAILQIVLKHKNNRKKFHGISFYDTNKNNLYKY
jgi:kinesin family protein 2/24